MVSKDDIIAELRQLVAKQAKQILALMAEVEQLKLQLAKATKNSSNSSKSPSSDITKPKDIKSHRKRGRPKKRKIGGQPGREKKLREPLPADRVNETIVHELDSKDISHLNLVPTDRFDTIQMIELPDRPLMVTEHQFRNYEAPDGSIYYQHNSEIHGQPIFGPRLLAMVSWMKSRAHCSYTTIEQYFDDVLQVPVSRGYLAKLCTGVISESLAEQLLNRTRKLFSAWHTRGEKTEVGLERSLKLHRDRFLEIVRNVPKSTEASTLAARFAVVEVTDGTSYDMSEDYFRFLFYEGVEPTNNHSEQQVRHVVIDRRITQGTRSERGQRYHERMWTAIATCQKQEKNFFAYLYSSIRAKLNGHPAPSLIG